MAEKLKAVATSVDWRWCLWCKSQRTTIPNEKSSLVSISDALQLIFPEIEHFLSRTEGSLYWHIVQKFPHPHLVLQRSSTELTSIILEATPKNMGLKRAQHLAEHLLELAKSSGPALDIDSYALKRVTELTYEVERLDRLKKSLYWRDG